jgi:hypothetical protein
VKNSINQNKIMHLFSLRQTFVLMLLSVLLGGASLIGLGSLDQPLDPLIVMMRYALIGTSLLLILKLSGFNKWNFCKQTEPLFLLWILYSFVSVISGIANQDLVIIREGFWQITGSLMFFFILYLS